MNFNQVNAFHAVAKFGSFSKAAEHLRISQPAVSQHVKSLEETIGKRLFLREGRKIVLTPAGLETMHSASLIVTEMEDLKLKFSERLRMDTGPVTIGLASHYFMQLIAVFIAEFPEIEIHIEFGNTAEMYELLYNFKADVAFITQTELDAGFFNHTFYHQQVLGCVPENHPWAGTGRIPFEEFCGSPLIFREQGSQTRAVFDAEVKKRGLVLPPPLLNVTSREVLKEGIAAGIGPGYVFDVEFGKDSRVRPVWFSDADLSASQTLTCLKSRENSWLVKALLRIIHSYRFPALSMVTPERHS
ncbi:MAG: LysR substrate-binding domain-containing protein [Desulfobacter sp.]